MSGTLQNSKDVRKMNNIVTKTCLVKRTTNSQIIIKPHDKYYNGDTLEAFWEHKAQLSNPVLQYLSES